MKYTIDYCKNNKVAIQVNSEEELKELYSYFVGYDIYQPYRDNHCYNFSKPYITNSVEFCDIDYYKERNFEIITFQQFKDSQMKYLKDFTDKDVIHCETKEQSNKIKQLLHDNGFSWSSGDAYMNLDYYSKYRNSYIPRDGVIVELAYMKDKTIHKAEDILALYETNMKENLEEYIVKCDTQQEMGIAANFVKGHKPDYVWVLNYKYVIKANCLTNSNLYNEIPEQVSPLPILTFKEFQDKIMKEKKIIGYLAPMNLFGGKVVKGTIFKPTSSHPTSVPMYLALDKDDKIIHSTYTLPKEIVETWEAVLEDEFKVGDYYKVVSNELYGKVKKCNSSYYTIGLIGKITNIQNDWCFLNNCVSAITTNQLVKATQAEIDSLFNKTLTLSNGKEVVINKGVCVANNEIVSLDVWKALLPTFSKLNNYDVSLTDATYKIGCWTNVKLDDIQLIIKTVEEMKELMN